jgi:hypothetical protein
VNGPILWLHLFGLFRSDRDALRLRSWTNHLGPAHHWPAQNADYGSGDEDNISGEQAIHHTNRNRGVRSEL